MVRRLRELARRRGIGVVRYPLAPYFQGLYWRSAGGPAVIGLDTSLRGRELAHVLAHELIHACLTPADFRFEEAAPGRVRHEERRVDRGALLLLRLVSHGGRGPEV